MPNPDDDSAAEETKPAAELLGLLYRDLRGLAAALLRKLPPGQTLQPTALVHEAYLRMVGAQDPGWEGRRHFFGAAARAMRNILIEQARSKAALKRGGTGQRVELAEGLAWIEPPAEDVLALDEAIAAMEVEEPQLAEMVVLRYFTGLSLEETAAVVGRSVSTLTREWCRARAWLTDRLGQERMPETPGAVDA